MEDLYDRSDATGLAAAIRSGEVSAAEVAAFALDRIAERNPALNAVTEVAAPGPAADGPLAGVPFVVKDLGMDVAGMRSTNGSRLFADRVAAADSELVARYRRAGLVIVGTTATPEFGKNASTESLLFGPTRNPHDLTRSPGGSSGGTAAAIASGMVPIGHGNDGGGSIRIPASACGLVGLKPSRGRTPSHPRRTAFAYPLGINHVLTRSVRDTALLLDLTAGPMPGDPFVIAPPTRPYVDEVGAPVGRLRLGVSTTRPDGGAVHADCIAAVEKVAAQLAELGHEVEWATPDHEPEALQAAMRVLMGVPLVVDVDARLAEVGRPLADDDLEPFTRVMYEMGKATAGTEVTLALQGVERAAQSVGPFFERFDALLTPTIAQPSPPLGLLDTTNPASMYEHASSYSAMTAWVNVTGQPAISLPLATGADGMPIGVQLVAGFGREDLLLRMASQLEAAHPW